MFCGYLHLLQSGWFCSQRQAFSRGHFQHIGIQTRSVLKLMSGIAGSLYCYTRFTIMLNGWYGMLVRLSAPAYSFIFISSLESAKVFWRERTFKYTLVPDTKGNSDLWKHFSLCKRKTDGRIDAAAAACKWCNSVVKFVGGALNMSVHVKHHHPFASHGYQSNNEG